MSDVGLSIIATECQSACAGEPDLEKRIQKAMAAVAKGHWMYCGDHEDDLRFRGALGGVLLAPETTEEDKARITATLKHMRAFESLAQGVPVDMGRLVEDMEDGPKVLPLISWWHDAKADKAA